MDERTVCETPTLGKHSTSIPTWKYVAIRNAILKIVPKEEPGIAAMDLPKKVGSKLRSEALAKIGSISWHTTTVKLDMECKGELRRIRNSRPQYLVRT